MGSKASVSLVLLDRGVYSLQWFVLAPALAALISSGSAPRWLVGALPFAFIVGAAAFQLVGAEASSVLGARNAFLLGFSVLSASDVIVAFSRGAWEAVALRLLAGVGAGLFFSPAGYYLVQVGGAESTTMMGLYNAAFELGGSAALAWGLVDGVLGWRLGTLVAGVIGLALALASLLLLPENPRPPRPRELMTAKGVELVIAGTAGAGAFGASYVLGLLLPYYASVEFGANPYTSGTLTALSFVGGALGGLIPLALNVVPSASTTVLLLVVSSITYLGLLARPYEAFLVMTFINGLMVNWAASVYYGHVVERFGRAASTTSLALMNAVNMLASLWMYPVASLLTSTDLATFPAFLAVTSAGFSTLLLTGSGRSAAGGRRAG
ncbi:MAG: MFS transporter [Acidilobus sp.]